MATNRKILDGPSRLLSPSVFFSVLSLMNAPSLNRQHFKYPSEETLSKCFESARICMSQTQCECPYRVLSMVKVKLSESIANVFIVVSALAVTRYRESRENFIARM